MAGETHDWASLGVVGYEVGVPPPHSVRRPLPRGTVIPRGMCSHSEENGGLTGQRAVSLMGGALTGFVFSWQLELMTGNHLASPRFPGERDCPGKTVTQSQTISNLILRTFIGGMLDDVCTTIFGTRLVKTLDF